MNTSTRYVLLPNLGGLFFVYLLFGFLFVRPLMLLWEGGVCRHLLNGLWIWSHHVIPLLSYTLWSHPEIPSESRCWLGDAALGLCYNVANLNGMVAICSLAICLALTWSYQIARARGLGALSGLLLLVVVLGATGLHFTARCHIFSYLPMLVVYYFSFVSPASPVKRLIACALTMAVAVNIHGAFAISLIVLAAKCAGDLSLCLSRGKDLFIQSATDPRSELKWSVIILAASFFATFLNPRGPALYPHLIQFANNPVISKLMDEWRSLDLTIGIGPWCFLLLFALGLWIIIAAKKFPHPADSLLFLLLFVAGVRSMRLIPYFALLVMPIVGPSWQVLKLRAAQSSSSLFSKFLTLEERGEAGEKLKPNFPFLMMAIAAVMVAIFMSVPMLRVKEFDSERMPVKTVTDLAKVIDSGPGFNYDGWGSYIYYRLSKPVFIDDWEDFLPMSFIDEYLTVIRAEKGWPAIMDKYKFVWVLVPKESPLVSLLQKTGAWHIESEDNVGTLLVKTNGDGR